jgi:dihydrofolate synthase/folylpolyglutamate synthase
VSLPYALGADALLAPRLEQRILPGLDRVQRALDALGRPERAFASVLVLGTNGKGSAAALLAGILQAHGVSVGLYTSPHLIAVEERIRTDGVLIAGARLAELVASFEHFPDLSYFETLTCAAVVEFAERRVDVAVMEAGLGGRWDAASAVEPVVALLTNVGTDHQRWLGTTRTAIAAEKAAALRGREAIVGTWDDEVEPIIRASANQATPISLASHWATVTTLFQGPQVQRPQGSRGAGEQGGQGCDKIGLTPLPLSTSAPLLSPYDWTFEPTHVRFTVGDVSGEAALPLAGAHQLANLTLALSGAAALAKHGVGPAIEAGAVRRGIEGVSWPGRLQRCRIRGRELLVDGAHNFEAMCALADALDSMGLSGNVHLLFSCLNDKPLAAMAALLRPRVTGVTVAPIASPRATPLTDLEAAFPGCHRAGSVAAALLELPADRTTLVTGSLRLAGEVLATEGGGHA